MDFSSALVGFLPLIVFAIVDMFAGMRKAIIAAIIIAVGEAIWTWHAFGAVDPTTWISLGLVLLMGLISLRMQDARLFKLQPVMMAFVLVVTFSWFEWQGHPLLVQMMPKVGKLLSPEQQWIVSDERMIKSMARLDLLMIGVFLAHGALVAWSALRKSTLHWILMRGVGVYVLMGIAMLLNFLIPLSS
jgi:intracellular septation protein A